jgi:hypothetical protein
MAVAVTAGTSRIGAWGATSERRRTPGSIDVLLCDETIEMPLQIAALIDASRQTLPVVGIQLDAVEHAALKRVLLESHSIVGISSGATLFCLERISWDHGFRLTGRIQRCANEVNDAACMQGLAAFLSGANPPVATPSQLTRAYRPSRADGTLHAWAMRKSVSRQLREEV